MERIMYTYSDVMKICKVGRTKAYEIVKEIRTDLYKSGFRTIQGRVPAKYINENYNEKI